MVAVKIEVETNIAKPKWDSALAKFSAITRTINEITIPIRLCVIDIIVFELDGQSDKSHVPQNKPTNIVAMM